MAGLDQDGGRLALARPTWLRDACRTSPVACCFLGMALVLIVLWGLGFQLNGDGDDLLKLHEVRFLLETGHIFDRTLPGILQPEPYVSHWPWIVDLPYAAFAAMIMPILGEGAALSVASFAAPLLLLLPTLYFYSRLVVAAGFSHTAVALPIAAIFALRGFFEFAPDRIDYHNLQVLLLLATLTLIFSQSRLAAFVNGLLAALALAISLEFAGFYALVFAIYAWDFVFARDEGAQRLAAFGVALAVAAIMLFAAIVPPSVYGAPRCDTYSAPYALALVCAGASFAIAPLSSRRHGGWMMRAAILAVLAAASAAALVLLFPQCQGGPYAALSDYVRQNLLGRIDQEKSLFQLPDFVLSGNAVSMTILFIGALAPVAVCIARRGRDRALVILALFSLLSLIQAIAYFRYFRYVPFFAGIGMLFVLAAVLPMDVRLKSRLANRMPAAAPSGFMLIVPGLAVAAAMVLFHLAVKMPAAVMPAAELAESCDLRLTRLYDWPAGAIVLSPPGVGSHLLVLAHGPAVVAIPNHPAALGIEKAYRFLDPQTPDPRAVLDASKATHVALCAWRGEPLTGLAERYPLAAALMQGQPPSWLTECPTDAPYPLRIYSYRNADGSPAACPSPTASHDAVETAGSSQATMISTR